MSASTPEDRLSAAGYTLPAPPQPRGNYARCCLCRNVSLREEGLLGLLPLSLHLHSLLARSLGPFARRMGLHKRLWRIAPG